MEANDDDLDSALGAGDGSGEVNTASSLFTSTKSPITCKVKYSK